MGDVTGDWAFSPDGRLLAVGGGRAGKVGLWDLRAKRWVASLVGHQGGRVHVAFSPDNRWLATGGSDYTVRLWSRANNAEAAVLHGHRDAVACVAFTPDSRALVSGGIDGIRFWRAAPKSPAELIPAYRSDANSVAFSPDSRRLGSSGGGDHAIRIWDLASRREIVALRGHAAPVNYLALSSDGHTVASGEGARSIRVWDLRTRREIVRFEPRKPPLYHPVAFSPDGKTLAYAGEEYQLKLWDIDSRRGVATLLGHRDLICAIKYSPDGRYLASCGIDNCARVWDAATRREVATVYHSNSVFAVAFSRDGRYLASGGYDPAVRIWDLVEGREVASLRGHTSPIGQLEFLPDGRTLVASSLGDPLKLWSVGSWQAAGTLKVMGLLPSAVAVSPDGSAIAAGSSDGTIRLWRAPTFRQTDPLHAYAAGGDRSVILRWQPLPHAVSYRVYRRRAGPGPAVFERLATEPAGSAAYADRGGALQNGSAREYAVTALYKESDGQEVEGERVRLHVTPVAVPPGWEGCSIDDGPQPASVTFDGGDGKVVLRRSPNGERYTPDACYFLYQAIEGDFSLRMTLAAVPADSPRVLQSDLQIRETLAPRARSTHMVVFSRDDGGVRRGALWFFWRAAAGDSPSHQPVLSREELKLPAVLQLTRRGETIHLEVSFDDGRNFRPAGRPWRPLPPLPRTVYAGLRVWPGESMKESEARFRDLEVRKLSR